MGDRSRGVLPIPELYDLNTDWTQARDLAARMPGKLRHLQRQFLIEAAKYNVLPLDNRLTERANCYSLFGLTRYTVTSDAELAPGTHLLRMEFGYDGGGLGQGGTVTLDLDGIKVGEGRVDATVPFIFSADETLDLGRDAGSAVSDDYAPGDNAFAGTVNWVRLDIGGDSQDHLITPEDRLRAALTRQ